MPTATNREAGGGIGAHADIAGRRCAIGQRGMFAVPLAEASKRRRRLAAEGKTVLLNLVGDHDARGLVALRGTVWTEARAAVADLRRLGSGAP